MYFSTRLKFSSYISCYCPILNLLTNALDRFLKLRLPSTHRSATQRMCSADYSATLRLGSADYSATQRLGSADYSATQRLGLADYSVTQRLGLADYSATQLTRGVARISSRRGPNLQGPQGKPPQNPKSLRISSTIFWRGPK